MVCLAVGYARRPCLSAITWRRTTRAAIPPPSSPTSALRTRFELIKQAGVHRLPVTEDALHAVGMLSFDEIAVDVKNYLDAFLSVAGRYHRGKQA